METQHPTMARTDRGLGRECRQPDCPLAERRRHGVRIDDAATLVPRPHVSRRHPAPEHHAERQRGDQDEDAEPQIRISPAHRLVEISKHRRPDGAADALPGRDQADREAAPVLEPAHHVDAQRTVDGRVAEQPNHHAVDEVQLPPRVDRADEHRAGADHGQAEQGHRSRSGAVEPVTHGDAADSGAGEEQRVGEGRHGARPVEIARHLLEAHHQQEHSTVGGHHQVSGDNEHCDAEGSPLRSSVGCARASHFGTRLSGSPCRLEIHQVRTLGQAPSHPRPGQASRPSSRIAARVRRCGSGSARIAPPERRLRAFGSLT